MKTAIYPGSFDPLHNGHLDIIERSSLLCDSLTVAVVNNPYKAVKRFELDERLAIIRTATAHLKNIEVDVFEGLLVAYVKFKGAETIIKGLRTSEDFAFESQMAHMNRHMEPTTETLFLLSEPKWSFLSSSRVRELDKLGVDLSDLVPSSTLRALESGRA